MRWLDGQTRSWRGNWGYSRKGLANDMLSANYFAFHYQGNEPIWKQRVLCVGRYHNQATANRSDPRQCIRQCIESNRYMLCP